jgi:hypothetical protein
MCVRLALVAKAGASGFGNLFCHLDLPPSPMSALRAKTMNFMAGKRKGQYLFSFAVKGFCVKKGQMGKNGSLRPGKDPETQRFNSFWGKECLWNSMHREEGFCRMELPCPQQVF